MAFILFFNLRILHPNQEFEIILIRMEIMNRTQLIVMEIRFIIGIDSIIKTLAIIIIVEIRLIIIMIIIIEWEVVRIEFMIKFICLFIKLFIKMATKMAIELAIIITN